jgi:hypothetical protein
LAGAEEDAGGVCADELADAAVCAGADEAGATFACGEAVADAAWGATEEVNESESAGVVC